MSNVLKENYKKLVDALAPYFGGASDFDDLNNRPQESDTIDIDDLDLPMPAKPTEYPVLFDETGTEYRVGYYKRASDGKVKPVYRKTLIATSNVGFNSGAWTRIDTAYGDISQFVSNIEKLIGYDLLIGNNHMLSPSMLLLNYPSTSQVSIYMTFGNDIRTGSFLKLQYTKTTDSWKEV